MRGHMWLNKVASLLGPLGCGACPASLDAEGGLEVAGGVRDMTHVMHGAIRTTISQNLAIDLC